MSRHEKSRAYLPNPLDKDEEEARRANCRGWATTHTNALRDLCYCMVSGSADFDMAMAALNKFRIHMLLAINKETYNCEAVAF